jgi:hypothetical protein
VRRGGVRADESHALTDGLPLTRRAAVRRMSAVAGAAVIWSAPVVRSVHLTQAAGTPPPQPTDTTTVVVTDPPTTAPPTSAPMDRCRVDLRLKGAYNLERSYDLAGMSIVPNATAPVSVGARSAAGSDRFELLMTRVSPSEHSAFTGALGVDLDGAPMTFRISGHWDDEAMTLQGSAVAAQGASLKLRFVCG